MILILGGTTEGRAAVKTADEAGSPYFYSTRDAHQQVDCHHGTRLTGAMDEEAMEAFCREKEIRLLVDAAHPFAEVLHRTVAVVAERLSLPVVRYERVYPPRSADIIWCDDYDDAIRRMEADGVTRLLALTGVQTIGRLRAYWQAHDACIFRILDLPTSLALAEWQGFPRERIVYYQPGGDEALLERVRPQAILTKESGESGGFIDKVEAAHKLGIAVYAVRRPPMPAGFVTVTGRHGFRKQIERFVPGFFPLRSGYTTGSCATAAAKAALMALLTGEEQSEVSYALPDGEVMTLPIAETHLGEREATAAVIKDAGDDPDVTNGCKICATVALRDGGGEGIRFLQGEGVGRVTLPGLGLEIGGPAINRTPREMITRELTALCDAPLDVTIAVPGGEKIARQTFNPKLGIVDGISIVGTSGVVKPFSSEAFIASIVRQADVAVALGADTIVINSGAKSEKYLKAAFPELPFQSFVQYGNFIGETLEKLASLSIPKIYMGIMLGKAVKLAEGNMDTHSKKVVMNKAYLHTVATKAGCTDRAHTLIDGLTLARELWQGLSAEDLDRFMHQITESCHEAGARLVPESELSVLLIDDEGNIRYTYPRDFFQANK